MMLTVVPVSAVFPLLTMLLMGGGVGLPLGVPPLPEDPMLARIAPEECLAYTSWAGMDTPDAKSKNQTEQFLAEPEIQQLFSEVERVVLAKIGENTPQQQAAMARDAIRWGKMALMRPTAAFVSSVGITPAGPDVHGGLVINVGKDAAELKADLEKYQAALPRPAEKVEIGGVSCYQFKIGPGATVIAWGIKGKYFVAGVGDGSLEGILQRAHGSPPAWLTALRKQLPVERPSTLTYLNVKKGVQQFAPMGGPQVRTMIDAAGLGNVTSLAAVSGLEGEGFVSRTLVGIEGKPAGIFSIAAAKPLGPQDLAAIPRGANLAAAGRLDLARLTDTLLAAADRIQPQAAQEINQNLEKLREQLGVDLRKDVIASLGDVWCAYNSSDEGGLILSGLTVVVQVKDFERLSAAHAKLLALAKAALAQGNEPSRKKTAGRKTAEEVERADEAAAARGQVTRPASRIEHLRFAEEDVYFLSANDFPIAPAWCLTRSQLILATFPQQIKAYLSRRADFKSLAAAPEVADALKSGEGPIGLWYFDARSLLDYLYPMMCMGVQMASRELAREGIDLNVSIIPSAPTIYKHLRPGVTVLRRTASGIEVASRGTVPGSSLGSAAPFAVGLLLPAVSSARESARRAQSANNLSHIVLAMHTYAAVWGTFPQAYLADKKTGKPLLSWRVAILPYLDQQCFTSSSTWTNPGTASTTRSWPTRSL